MAKRVKVVDRERCGHCQRPWVKHLGPMGVCERLEKARTALRTIRLWARNDRRGDTLCPPETLKLCEETLKAIQT